MNAKFKMTIRFIALVIIILSFFGFLSLYLGKDQNWDLRNYHFYNAYAFLNNRIKWDIVPAQWQTYINPLPDLPFYWMAKWMPAKVIGFILGFVHGLNVTLVFLIFWNLIELKSVPQKCLLGVFVAAISAFAPGFLSEIGTTFNDNLVSIFILAALLILILGSKTLRASYLIALAGLVMGMGVGMKLNVIIYVIGSGIALPLLFDKWLPRIRALLLYGAGGILGVATTAAAWSWRLWMTFGNPLLPFYNDVFRSPYVLIAHYTDTRFLPHSVLENIFWPIIFTANTYRVNEIKFSDMRFAVLYVLILFAGIKFLLNWMRGKWEPLGRTNGSLGFRSGGFLFVFFLSSFILWMKMFSIYRYIIILELLAPICAAIVIDRITSSSRVKLALGMALAILVMVTYSPLSWGRGDWSDPYLFVDTSRLVRNEKSIVVMLGQSPIAYAVPFFPSGMRFIRPEGNMNLTDKTLFMQEIKGLLKDSPDRDFFVFYDQEERVNPVESISKLGIDAKMQECFTLRSNMPDQLEICRFSRP